jgi:hypothetical protein
VPETVRAAVLARLARLARLSRQGHAVLDLASVVPARTEWWLFEAIHDQPVNAVEECAQAGVLRVEADAVAFRHELARQAVESTLSSPRRKELHAQVLRALLARGDEPSTMARLVHHAALAGDGVAVLRYALPRLGRRRNKVPTEKRLPSIRRLCATPRGFRQPSGQSFSSVVPMNVTSRANWKKRFRRVPKRWSYGAS